MLDTTRPYCAGVKRALRTTGHDVVDEAMQRLQLVGQWLERIHIQAPQYRAHNGGYSSHAGQQLAHASDAMRRSVVLPVPP